MSSRNPSPLSIVCAARGAAALPGSYRADHAIFPESQLSAMAAQGYELGQRLDRLSQHQRQCAGDPVN